MKQQGGLIWHWILIGWFGLSTGVFGQSSAGSGAVHPRPAIVAIYFPGYHQDDHYDSWFGEGWNEWKLLAEAPTRFPNQRIFRPAWGEFDEANPGWMAKQVALAADHGVDVFLFDWYWYSGVKILQRPLEQGFLQATNQNRLKFALMWANHDWRNYFPAPKDQEPTTWLPSRTSPRDFARLMDYCIKTYFGHLNYWRAQGGLYFGIFDSASFMRQLGGPKTTRAVLEAARRQIRAAGLGEIHFGAFHGDPGGIAGLQEAGFDSVTTYNITSSGKASLSQPLDAYSDVVERHVAFWKSMDTGALPVIPTLPRPGGQPAYVHSLGGSQGASDGSLQAVSHHLVMRPQAVADIADAAAWYEQRQPGLGERFTREVVTAIDAVLANPLIHRLRNRRLGARWCFPRTWANSVPVCLWERCGWLSAQPRSA